MIVKGYRTLFHRGQRDVSDSVRLLLSRIDPVFTVSMPTLQPREEMKISVRNGVTYANYISIEYDNNDEPQPFRQVWYYFAEYDPGSPSTPANTVFSLYADWWAMSVDWWGEDPVGIRIKHGELVQSHAFITGTAEQKRGTSAGISAVKPLSLETVIRPQARYPSMIAIVALYHVNGSIFSIPGTDKYLQVIVPISGESGTPAKQSDATEVLYYLANGKTVTYTLNYTDEEGKAQTFTESPDISECVGMWVLPHWIFDDMFVNSPGSVSSATVKCQALSATSAVIPVGLAKNKDYSGYAVSGDYAAVKKLEVSGDLIKFRYFGNPGANIILPQTLETITAQVFTRFSVAQQSFSVKFAAAGSVVDATSSLSVNISKENTQIEIRNNIIKGGISAITAAIGMAAAGPAGAGVGLLAAGSRLASTAASGVGLANSSRYAEGMDGVENMLAYDYKTGNTQYIYGCAVVEYKASNEPEIVNDYNERGAVGCADVFEIGRDENHKYNFYRFDDLEIGTESTACEPARRAIREMLINGVRIWDDIQATNLLTVKSWQ